VRDDRKLQRELGDEAADEQLRQYQPGRQQLRRGKIFSRFHSTVLFFFSFSFFVSSSFSFFCSPS